MDGVKKKNGVFGAIGGITFVALILLVAGAATPYWVTFTFDGYHASLGIGGVLRRQLSGDCYKNVNYHSGSVWYDGDKCLLQFKPEDMAVPIPDSFAATISDERIVLPINCTSCNKCTQLNSIWRVHQLEDSKFEKIAAYQYKALCPSGSAALGLLTVSAVFMTLCSVMCLGLWTRESQPKHLTMPPFVFLAIATILILIAVIVAGAELSGALPESEVELFIKEAFNLNQDVNKFIGWSFVLVIFTLCLDFIAICVYVGSVSMDRPATSFERAPPTPQSPYQYPMQPMGGSAQQYYQPGVPQHQQV